MKLYELIERTNGSVSPAQMDCPKILVHVLAKDKEATLPFYLETLEAWTYPKHRIVLYIRTNNNKDQTKTILDDWVASHGGEYLELIYDSSDLNVDFSGYSVHEWNVPRLDVIRHLRDKGLMIARDKDCDFYFTSDVDNYLVPDTLERLVGHNAPVVAPLLRYAVDPSEVAENAAAANWTYSNFTNVVNHWGDTQHGTNDFPVGYFDILNQNIKGLFVVDLVHATYLVHKDVFWRVSYQNGTEGFDYIKFSCTLRVAGIMQILDNTKLYGCMTLAENADACRKFMAELS